MPTSTFAHSSEISGHQPQAQPRYCHYALILPTIRARNILLSDGQTRRFTPVDRKRTTRIRCDTIQLVQVLATVTIN